MHTNSEIAKAMREMADMIEQVSDEHNLGIYCEIRVHGVYQIEQLQAAAVLLGEKPEANRARGTHWLKSNERYSGPVCVTVYYAGGLLSKKTKKVRVIEHESNPDLSILKLPS